MATGSVKPGSRVADTLHIQYVSDEKGRATAVLVPINLWREIASECENRTRRRQRVAQAVSLYLNILFKRLNVFTFREHVEP